VKEGDVKEDKRLAQRLDPQNKLTTEERQEILDIVNTDEFAELPLS
jgi:hypothetical protein